MNSTPIYAINQQPLGAVQLGAVQYGKSSGLHSSVSQLPTYAGEAWDNFTPWDTKAEKKAKAQAKKEEDELYKQQIEALGQTTPVDGPSPVMIGVLVVGLGLGLYFLSKG